VRTNQYVKSNASKNCAIGRNIFDSDSGCFTRWKLGSRHFSSNLGLGRNIRYSRFFPKQEEKVASIKRIIDFIPGITCFGFSSLLDNRAMIGLSVITALSAQHISAAFIFIRT
jgi:hypothetical protein